MSCSVLIVGGGGREHALAWKLSKSPKVGKIYIAPGNAGTRDIAENLPYLATDVAALANFATERKIDLTVVGPDEALSEGIVDFFKAHGLKIFGPTKGASRIEWSKSFAKGIMAEAKVPTVTSRVFHTFNQALDDVRSRKPPMVVKANGLAFGKGVYLCQSVAEAEQALDEILRHNLFGNVGDEVIVEDLISGTEVSAHALSDGSTFKLWPLSQDHKQIFDGGHGPNTGGMGTIAPVPWQTPQLMETIEKNIISPTLAELRKLNTPFVGCLYPNLMLTAKGPMTLEFNSRFGDPEAQVYMRLLKSDLYDLLDACASGTLNKHNIEWQPGFAACVVMASEGYPEVYRTGFPISGIEEAEKLPGVVVFHAGTSFEGKLVTSGGRVLGVSAVGSTLKEAIDTAYEGVRKISFKGAKYRKDIGIKALITESSI